VLTLPEVAVALTLSIGQGIGELRGRALALALEEFHEVALALLESQAHQLMYEQARAPIPLLRRATLIGLFAAPGVAERLGIGELLANGHARVAPSRPSRPSCSAR
jgi:hypothetical protein